MLESNYSSSSSSSLDVVEVILKAVKSNNPEIRYLVGNDALFLIEKRQNITDKEFENWMKESLFEQKGFVVEWKARVQAFLSSINWYNT